MPALKLGNKLHFDEWTSFGRFILKVPVAEILQHRRLDFRTPQLASLARVARYELSIQTALIGDIGNEYR